MFHEQRLESIAAETERVRELAKQYEKCKNANLKRCSDYTRAILAQQAEIDSLKQEVSAEMDAHARSQIQFIVSVARATEPL